MSNTRIARLFPVVALAIVFGSMLFTVFHNHMWNRNEEMRRGVIRMDVISYYGYLPAVVIHGDPTLSFVDEEVNNSDPRYWYTELENGNRIIVTSAGMAYMYAPFFFVAHFLAPLLGQPADGFSNVYQFMLVFSGLLFSMLGIWILFNILRRIFEPLVTAIVLVVIGLGTNLFYYSTLEAAMPHSYNFFLSALFLWLVIRWYDKPGMLKGVFIGLTLGLISLIRPTNLLMVLILVLYDVRSWNDFTARIIFLWGKWKIILVMIAVFMVPWIPQFLYWKLITGHYLYFSYGAKDASFFFGHPHILENLFSFRKGWLIYTPVMWFALAGIPILWFRARSWFFPVLIYTLAMIYVQSSWWCWWFGGGWGLRPYIAAYPVLAIPLAFMLKALRKRASQWGAGIVMAMLLVLTGYQLFQTKQFRTHAIHWSGATKASYVENFLKVRPTGPSWKMLEMPDYNLARSGIYVVYPTSDSKERWREMDRVEAYGLIRKELAEDRKVSRQIDRYIERENLNREEVMAMILERMYERKAGI